MSSQLLSQQALDPGECLGTAGSSACAGAETSQGAVAAWVSLLRGHAALRRMVAAGLHTDHGLTVNEYEALLLLDDADGNRMRGVDMASALQLTPSGVTRLLDGLRARGLIEKVHCPNDARVTHAVLCDLGRQKLKLASCSHVARINALFSERYTAPELAELSALLARLPCAESGSAGDAARTTACSPAGAPAK